MALEERLIALTSEVAAAGLPSIAPLSLQRRSVWSVASMISRLRGHSALSTPMTEGTGKQFRQSSRHPITARAPSERTVAAPRSKSLVVTGQALAYILGDESLQSQFLTVAVQCSAVLACRVSPPQKASLVKLVWPPLCCGRACAATVTSPVTACRCGSVCLGTRSRLPSAMAPTMWP